MRPHGESGQRHILPADADTRATHVPVRDQLADDELHRVDGNRKTDALRGQNDRRVDADDVAARVEQRAARIPRIQRRVRLNDVVDQTTGHRAERATEGADHACCHRTLKAERIPDRDDDLTDAECR